MLPRVQRLTPGPERPGVGSAGRPRNGQTARQSGGEQEGGASLAQLNHGWWFQRFNLYEKYACSSTKHPKYWGKKQQNHQPAMVLQSHGEP